jgi:hypothetical protein
VAIHVGVLGAEVSVVKGGFNVLQSILVLLSLRLRVNICL